MGRGHAYQHRHFMLFDDREMDDIDVTNFRADIITTLKLVDFGRESEHSDTIHLGETREVGDTVMFWVDFSGGIPCIFADYPYNDEDSQEEFEMDNDEPHHLYIQRVEEKIGRLFNKLIETFGDDTFLYPTSAWTSENYTRENLYMNNLPKEVSELTEEELEDITDRFNVEFTIKATQECTLNLLCKTVEYGAVEAGENLTAIVTDRETGGEYEIEVNHITDDEELYIVILKSITSYLSKIGK